MNVLPDVMDCTHTIDFYCETFYCETDKLSSKCTICTLFVQFVQLSFPAVIISPSYISSHCFDCGS